MLKVNELTPYPEFKLCCAKVKLGHDLKCFLDSSCIFIELMSRIWW
jgi:hypothetical protein